MSWSDTAAPGEAREQWYRDAAERDGARLAEGPDDDTETDDSPWRESFEPEEPTLEEEFAGRMDAADNATRLEDAISRRRQERRLVEAMTNTPAADAAPDLEQLRELLTAVKNDPMAGLPWWLDSTPGGADGEPDGTTDVGGIVARWERTVHDHTGAAVDTEPAVNELGSINPPLAEALAVAAVNALPWLLNEVAELRAIFDLGYRRSEEATALWRAEDPEARAGVHPDLGALLTWLMDRAGQGGGGNEEVWHEFHDGPWAGQRIEIEPSPDGYEHLVPHRPEPGVGEWVPEGAADRCYARTGSYGETTVMTWRQSS